MVIDLGFCMARINKMTLTIVSPEDSSDTVYMPASSVSIFGKSNLIALRDSLDKALQQDEAQEIDK